jgi:hypothetical protein
MAPRLLRLMGALVLLCGCLSALGLATPDLPPRLSTVFPKIGADATYLIEIPDSTRLILAGPLTPTIATNVGRILERNKRIDTLYIDLDGGDVRAAMALGDMIRQRNRRLVVAGACFSACANYLFTAARAKLVLPGSLVGIHNPTYH